MMDLICFTDSKYIKEEAEQITGLFSAGLKILHIRKKNKSKSRLKILLNNIPYRYHNRIIIHNHYALIYTYNLKGIHITRSATKTFKKKLAIGFIKLFKPKTDISRSIHQLDEIKTLTKKRYCYVFLSPVFDSISKQGYMGSFTESDLRNLLPQSNCPVIALGGVEPKNVRFTQQVGFKGVAALGYLWKDKKIPAIERFKWLLESVKPIHLG